VAGWDKPIDPDGDCTFRRDYDTLTIEVPAKEHDLNVPRHQLNAPRLLRDVSGDFETQVRVSGDFRPVGAPGGQTRHNYAGLVLMADDEDFLRFQWDGTNDAGNTTGCAYVYWERHKDRKGSLATIGRPGTQPADRLAAYLRMGRRGDTLYFAYSEDGKKWRERTSLDEKLPTKLKLGVFAATDSAAPFKPRFDRFQLTVKGTARSN
jgi:regulation of enolase protein 1 (concanavalin A-like superfamily)